MTASCGPVREPVAGPSTDLAVRQSGECVTEAFPQPLPAAAALLDTARLTRELQALLRDAQVPAAVATLTLWYEPDGQNVRRDLMRHSLPQELADTVQQLVFAALGRGPEMERAWGARLHIGVAQEVAYTTSAREYCPPRPRSRTIQAEMETYQGTGVGARTRGRAVERTVLMEVTVHPAGWVEAAKVLRGATSGGSLEHQLQDYLRQHSFIPASLDGVPVQGSLAVPIRLRG
ncbi:MAG TPA: hypothetical protein VF006_04085 [Longimicrobium sp.]